MRPHSHRSRFLGGAVGLVVVVASLGSARAGAEDRRDGTVRPVPGASAGLGALRRELEGADIATLAAKAAEIQAAFVAASTGYDQARTNAATAAEVAADKQQVVDELAAEADEARDAIRSSVLTAYADRAGEGSSPLVAVLLSQADSPGEVLHEAMSVDLALSLARTRAARSQQVLDHARIMAEEARRAEAAAAAAERTAEVLLHRIQKQARVMAKAAERAADAADEVARAQQAARDEAAREQWSSYVHSLDRAGVKAPRAHQMQGGDALPDRFDALSAAAAGVTTTRWRRSTLTVLPAETIALLTRAFGELGKPFEAGATGPGSYDCGGFTQAMWATQGFELGPDPAGQLAASVRVKRGDVQVGDLVFTGQGRGRIENVGIYVGAGLMLAADGPTSAVAVVAVPSPVAVARVTLHGTEETRRRAPQGRHARREPADSETVHCGLTDEVTTSAAFVSPVAEGLFRFTGQWGDTGPHWATYHTGLDFAAAPGTDVVAVLGGTVVSVAASPWAGPFYTTIDHGNGLETTYAHMERSDVEPGDLVDPGQLIGAVGAYGNATGPHLHLEVHLEGQDVDPMPYVLGAASSTGAGWGGLANGMIPTQLLCPVATAPGHLLRCDAARALDAMAAAYEAEVGSDFCVSDSYRSYTAQVALFTRKPSLAAVPGTSNHGWALAVDLCGGAESFGTPQRGWLAAHASRFGWVDPTWAREGGSKPEPWHWEFGQVP